ncbi:MAG: 2-succinyl-5-enolpyruvyl-6-hydroxy-3-cyclohexene-1-carboxylic-acid synthase [Acidobacteria bacterium]|nr:2-succinyl-5-enolpyruvyl-6-hydroxy-3-cyclohexene-1-carboxylic-acid synthase [Acidobacteriota bacterium]
MDGPQNLASTWSGLLLDGLAGAGVTDVVISPGSRSTPLVLAAAADGRLACRNIVDERSAAFFALGQARVTGRPSLLVCTSGTAGAHYLPAVIEASLSEVPLVVLTADRPPEMQHRFAPQTIDQSKLFGGFVRGFFELGAPDATPAALRGVRAAGTLAVHRALDPRPGPVHLNACFRKPLEPRPDGPADGELREFVRGLPPPVLARAARRDPDPKAIEDLAERCRAVERGLIVCGPAPLAQARDLAALHDVARASGFPVYAEATSQFRFAPWPEDVVRVDLFDVLARSPEFGRSFRPELILQFGGTPSARSWERLVAELADVPRLVVSPRGWDDPFNQAAWIVSGEPGPALRGLAARLGGAPRPPGAWARSYARAEAQARTALRRLIDEAGDELTEAAVVRAAVVAAPDDSLLALGNSLPVREVDMYATGDLARAGVLCQRGANGIDGLLSGAAGSAVSAGRAVTLLVGDVSLLHDLHGLLAARHVTAAPLVAVVIHNDGGHMFDLLPLAAVPGVRDAYVEHFVTPHGLALDAIVQGLGRRHAAASTAGELRQALARAHAGPGCTVVEARVTGVDAAEQARRFDELFAEALAGA